jgi:CPA1 family monovalent cation:H+ antiporter
MTVESALALFLMLALSSTSLFFAHRLKVPHTVALAALGVVLGFLTLWEPLAFLDDIALTPELLFYIFLPILIFESAFNINIRRLMDDSPAISLLSVVSLLISALVIAFLLDGAMSLLGLDIPFMLALVFGAIISATDPVAVLALFKEYGAPRRLSLIFEGESIFNDGTAVALFLVVLVIAESGVVNAASIVSGTFSFALMVCGGILFGLVFGGFFAKLVGYTRSNEFAAITLTMVLAHVTFICAELFSQNAVFFGYHMHVSAIIATTVASLFMGNYGRFKLPPHGVEFLEKYWGQFAFLANSIVFILIGMLAVKLPASAPQLLVPILLTILIVAFARALSIYPVVMAFNAFASPLQKIPLSWQHALAWGSLRGALAVTMVLLIPETLMFPGWDYPFTPRDLILTLTVGCIFATLFIKATTMSALMKYLRLDRLTPLEEVNYREMLIYVYSTTIKRLGELFQKGYTSEYMYEHLKQKQQEQIRAVLTDLEERTQDPDMLRRVIHLHAIGIERKYLWELFKNSEVSEWVAKMINSKLEYQSRAIERGDYTPEKYRHGNELDVFEKMAHFLKKKVLRIKVGETVESRYLYYRALSIIARKVSKELPELEACFATSQGHAGGLIRETIAHYDDYRAGSARKLQELREKHSKEIVELENRLARLAAYKNQFHILHNLREREMVTPKVAIALEERFQSETKDVEGI